MTQTTQQSEQSPAAQANAEPIIRLVDIHKAFGPLRVLSGVSLNFETGKTTVVLGPSGTGKSVMLKHIAGLLRPDKGQVWFEGKRVDTISEPQWVDVRKRIGFLFQMGALFDSMTVGENVCFPLVEHTDMSLSQRQDRCAQMLEMVGLSDTEQKMPADLSGGQRKRVALARAVVLGPQVVLYDEPTTGLDPIRADVINELILSLSEQLGITSIVVTHDMASARKIADRMVMLYDGHLIADAEPQAFLNSDNNFVQRFIRGEASDEELGLIHRRGEA